MYTTTPPRPATEPPPFTTDAPVVISEAPTFITGGNRPKAISCPTPVHWQTLHLPTVLETIVEKKSTYTLRKVPPSPDRRYGALDHCGAGMNHFDAGTNGSAEYREWGTDYHDIGVGCHGRGADGACDGPASVGRPDELEMQPILYGRAEGHGALGEAVERDEKKGGREKRAWRRLLARWLCFGAEENASRWPTSARPLYPRPGMPIRVPA